MKKWILLLLLSVSLSSCYTKKGALEKFGCKEVKTETKIETKEVIREVKVEIPGDSIPFFLPCDEPKLVDLKKGRAGVKAIYNKEKKGYNIVSNCDSLTKVVNVKDKIIETYRKEIVKDAYQPGDKTTWFGRQIKKASDFIISLLALIGLVSLIRWTISFLRPR